MGKAFVVEASSNYKRRSLVKLEAMVKANDFEGLGNIAFGLNKIALWHDMSLTEKEIALQLIKDIK